ncbi:SDR family oxidoreductase [Pontivivens insulae]|uniref:NAD-dependent epimerase/dehydratase domain-containing protein n=1 Tax=Pontivivens insulae TaxID=1639689 RepID=A0A2R8A6E8_9RHOB|nr:SDR family oxidoreductase [Pontivivens insulae]RED17909.1 uncharacterized protein YbjT (DUF2867 family) [Pontivivens insulae]SPF27799.1 hypothetical protein POI8812_00094 [Pontivivens insulae]
MAHSQNVLVLGVSGLIGAAIARDLVTVGHVVRGVARTPPRHLPGVDCISADLTKLDPAGWADVLRNIDTVVNAAGALQDGLRDNLDAIHLQMIEALVEAIGSRPIRVVQISAAGASADASTAFMRTKAMGDAVLQSSGIDQVILRPALVLAPTAYGGTALLRAAASLPGFVPRIMEDVEIQTVSVNDIGQTVLAAVERRIATGEVIELAEPDAYNFPSLIAQMRRWIGLPDGVSVPVPAPLVSILGRCADLAGWLGWHSPLRSTALKTLRDGVRAEPHPEHPCTSLPQTLAAMPATTQDLRFARTYLMLPVAIVTLALFWCVSGLIALLDPARAASVLGSPPAAWQMAFVYLGAFADIIVGLAVLVRRFARSACFAMMLISLSYMAGAALLAPALWLDPLGPMVKVIPGFTLAFVTASLLDER